MTKTRQLLTCLTAMLIAGGLFAQPGGGQVGAIGTHAVRTTGVEDTGLLASTGEVSEKGTTYNEEESNDSFSTANLVPDTATTIVGTIGTSTDKDYFKILVGAGVSLKVDMTGPAKDYDLYLYNSSGTQLTKSVGSSSTESLSYKNSGTSAAYYYIYVMGYNSAYTASAPYNLALTTSGAYMTVKINPETVSLSIDTTQQFTATVSGSTNPSVTWSCTGGGTISTIGLYTAPDYNCIATVKATSVADSSKFATATVTVTGGPDTGKTFIVSAVSDGLDTNDLYLMANGLKSLGYTQDTMDMNASSSEMVSYMGKAVTTYYHTGHGNSGGVVYTSNGTITNHSGTVNAENTFWATCLTVGDTGWKTAMGPNAQNVMGYSNYSLDAPTDDNVVKALISQLRNGKSYPMAWYLANAGISDVSDRWISYTRVGSSIVEYSARTGNLPTSRSSATWEPLGDSGRVWIAPDILDKAALADDMKGELQAEPAEWFDYVAPGEFSLLKDARATGDQAVATAERWLSEHQLFPFDAVLDKVIEIGRRTDMQEDQSLAGHMVVFTRVAQGKNVRGNGIQDHIVVMVSADSVVSVSSYWPQITETESTGSQSLLTARQAVEIAVPQILKVLKSKDAELFFDQVNPVWGTRGLYGTDRRLVPAFELRSNNGSSFVIDARDGSIVF